MSTTSPILLLSRSTMTRPRQPRTVSMLGVAMLASFLVGYLNRALPALSRSRAITCSLLLLAGVNLDAHSHRRRPWWPRPGGPSPGPGQRPAWPARRAARGETRPVPLGPSADRPPLGPPSRPP